MSRSVHPIPKRGAKNPVSRFFERMSSFDLLAVFDPKKPQGLPRSVLVGVPLPAHALTTAPKVAMPGFSSSREVDLPDGSTQRTKVAKGYGEKTVPTKGWIFESNQVLTSKYNIFTFVPRNLLEQVSRVCPHPVEPRAGVQTPADAAPLPPPL